MEIDAVRYIFLHSLFDERKCAQRFSFELKRAFENSGKTLERFDYYGTGEGEGDFCEVELGTLRKDIEHVCSSGNCVLIGLRFAAFLILDYLKCNPKNISGIVLINPVCDLNNYVQYLKRKQRIKDIMTGHKGEDQEEGCYINIEGYKTQKRFIEQLESYGEVTFKEKFPFPVNVITNGDCDKMNIQVKTKVMKYAPFWERIPAQDYTRLIDLILEDIGALCVT